MKKQFMSVVCASVLLGATSMAFAGARGEAEEAEELPTAVAAAPVMAEVEEPSPGYFYIGAGGIFAIENFHCDVDHAWGYEIRAGRRFNDWIAAEVEWEHPISKFDDADKVDGFGRLNGDVSAWAITANARFYPIHGRVQPYALIGAGYGQADLPHDQNDGFVARFGLGVEFLITDNFGLYTGADYLLGTGQLSDYDWIPIAFGAFYNFR